MKKPDFREEALLLFKLAISVYWEAFLKKQRKDKK